jgi:oligopeptide/dipeptide ABC transporter ATP-binding protein
MYLGRVVESATPDELFDNPKHPYTQALIRELPSVTDRRRVFTPIKGEIPSPLHPPPGCHFHPRCPMTFDRCHADRPALKENADGHVSACHLNDLAAHQATNATAEPAI